MQPVLTSVGSRQTRISEVPTSIEVMGQRYVVEVVEDHQVALDRFAVGVEHAVGLTDLYRGTMKIRGGAEQSPDALADTLLHEVLHTVAHLLKVEMEEDAVAAVSTGLLQTLRANPDLVRCLVE